MTSLRDEPISRERDPEPLTVTYSVASRGSIERALRQLAACSSVTGPDLYRTILHALSDALGARWAHIGTVDAPRPETIRTVAVIADGAIQDDLDYDLEGTPCAEVLAHGTLCFSGDLKRQFPDDDLLHEMGVEYYLGTPLRASDGSLLGLLAVQHDGPLDESLQPAALLELLAGRTAAAIELDRNMQALARSERNLSDFFDNSAVGLHWVNRGGFIVRANRAELEMMGYAGREQEYIGRHITDFHADSHVIADILERLGRGETINDYPARLVRRDGAIRHVLITSNALFEEGRFVHTRCFTRDVTDQRVAEEALNRSEEFSRRLIDSSSDCIKVLDLEGRLLSISDCGQRRMGIDDLSAYLNKSWIDWWGDHRSHAEQAVRAAAAGGAGTFEGSSQAVDGKRQWWEIILTPILGASGRPERLLAVSRDITERRRAEVALRESEARYRTLVDLLPAGVYVCAADGTITAYNRRAVELWGAEPNLGDNDQRFCGALRLHWPDGRPLPHEKTPMAECLVDGIAKRNLEVIIERPNASRITVLVNIAPLYDEYGNVVGAINCFQDITARKRVEQDLKRRLDQLRILYDLTAAVGRTVDLDEVYDAALDGLKDALDADRAAILLCDETGTMRFKAWRGLSDEYRAAVEGHSPWSPDDPDPKPIAIDDAEHAELGTLRDVVLGEGIRALAFFPLHRHGRLLGKFMVYYNRPHSLAEGDSRLATTIAGHISFAIERRRAEEARRRSEEEFRALAEHTPDVVGRYDRDLRHLYVSPAIEEATGIPRESFLGRTKRELGMPPDHCERWERICREVFSTGEPREMEFGYVHPATGEMRHFTARAVPELSASGDVESVLAVSRDITARRRAEDARARLAAIVESSEDAIISKTLDGTITSWNRGAERMYGYASEEIVGRPITVIHPPEQCGEEDRIIAQVKRGERVEPYETSRLTRDGRRIEVWLTLSPIVDNSGGIIGASSIARDITERKRIERELQAQVAFRQAVENSVAAGLVAIGPDRRVTYVNRAFIEMTGFSAAQVKGKTPPFPWWPRDEEPRYSAVLDATLRGEPPAGGLEARYVRSDGSLFDVLIMPSPLIGAGGEVSGYLAAVTDITAQKRNEAELARHRDQLEELVIERTVELEASYEQLRQAERMAALGTLSAGLGHDMGNLLLPLRLRLDAIERKTHAPDAGAQKPEASGEKSEVGDEALTSDLRPPAPDVREDIEAIRKCAEYLQRLTNGLRLFALDPNDEHASDEATDLHQWWHDVEPFLKNALPHNVELVRHLADDLPRIGLARHLLTQAMFNLVQNAGDALREQLERAAPGDRRAFRVCLNAEWDRRERVVRLAVSDDGPGMTADVRKRCMEPFFTTKPRGLSTGLGLALVHGIVLRARGRMEIDSSIGKGTTMTLVIPAPDEPLAKAGLEAESRGASPEAESHALVTIAEPRIRAFAVSVLRALSFEARAFDGPPEEQSATAAEAGIWLTDDAQRVDLEAPQLFAAGQLKRIVLVASPSDQPQQRDRRIVLLDPAEGRPGCWRTLRSVIADIRSRSNTQQTDEPGPPL